MSIFEALFLRIEWDEETRCVEMHWRHSVRVEDFRKGMDEGLGVLEWIQGGRLLADLRDVEAITTAALGWFARDWLPRALVAGLRDVAFIPPHKAIPRRAVDHALWHVQDRELRLESFDTPEQARAWLKSL